MRSDREWVYHHMWTWTCDHASGHITILLSLWPMLWVRIFTQSAVLLSIRFNALCIATAHAIHNRLLGWEHSERTCFATCHAMPCHEFNGVFRVMFSSPFGRPHRWHWAQCTAHSGPLHSHHCHVVWFSGFRLSSVAEHVHGVRWWTVKITQEKKI